MAFVGSLSQILQMRSLVNYPEGFNLIESILPISVGITLGFLAFVGIREFWHEFAVALKGGPQ